MRRLPDAAGRGANFFAPDTASTRVVMSDSAAAEQCEWLQVWRK